MSLYNHVPDKAAVLDAVHEAVLAELELPRRTGHWRRDARGLARAFRRTLLAHPHAVPLFAERPAFTHGSLAHVERALDVLRPGFPNLKDRIAIVQVAVAYVVGHVAQSLPRASARVPAYSALDPEAFPNLAHLEAALAGYDVEAEFEFGLAALLRGFEARPRRR
jgi:AcrR family transcriptional regulator